MCNGGVALALLVLTHEPYAVDLVMVEWQQDYRSKLVESCKDFCIV